MRKAPGSLDELGAFLFVVVLFVYNLSVLDS